MGLKLGTLEPKDQKLKQPKSRLFIFRSFWIICDAVIYNYLILSGLKSFGPHLLHHPNLGSFATSDKLANFSSQVFAQPASWLIIAGLLWTIFVEVESIKWLIFNDPETHLSESLPANDSRSTSLQAWLSWCLGFLSGWTGELRQQGYQFTTIINIPAPVSQTKVSVMTIQPGGPWCDHSADDDHPDQLGERCLAQNLVHEVHRHLPLCLLLYGLRSVDWICLCWVSNTEYQHIWLRLTLIWIFDQVHRQKNPTEKKSLPCHAEDDGGEEAWGDSESDE